MRPDPAIDRDTSAAPPPLPHPIRGFLIGPMVAPVAYWVGIMAYGLSGETRFNWFHALRELGVICMFGLPVAYAVALVWGAPVLYALHRLGWLRAPVVVAAGAIGGTVVAAWIASDQQGSLIRIHMPLAAGAALGALVAGTWWWVGQGKRVPTSAVT